MPDNADINIFLFWNFIVVKLLMFAPYIGMLWG
jgi:hypothetical protein